ncbi:MAG: hypothetical protein H7Y36_09855 [Armatimonadetes bacterium]|nr:hypothetical protein [Akkermansiaceae bacterium]
MGLEFIRKVTANYVQKRDSSRALTDLNSLWERNNPDRVVELFCGQLHDPSTGLEPGYRLLLKFDSEVDAAILQNGREIGKLDPTEAKEISRRMKESGRTSGMLDVLIHEAQDFSGNFKIKAAEPGEIHEP